MVGDVPMEDLEFTELIKMVEIHNRNREYEMEKSELFNSTVALDHLLTYTFNPSFHVFCPDI